MGGTGEPSGEPVTGRCRRSRVKDCWIGWIRTGGRWGAIWLSLQTLEVAAGSTDGGVWRSWKKKLWVVQSACCLCRLPFIDWLPSIPLLPKWLLSTRLETRTKESNSTASIRVANSGCVAKAKRASHKTNISVAQLGPITRLSSLDRVAVVGLGPERR